MFKRFLAPLAALALLPACATLPSAGVPATGAVSAADPRAQAAGEEILAAGGSATDAAIATMLALTVVEPQSSGIGGGGFLVRGTADGAVETLDGRETAPAAASGEWFLDADGKPVPFRAAVQSGLSVGVPGNVMLAVEAHRRHGKLAWADLFQPAIRLARQGFVMNPRLNQSLTESIATGGADADAQAIFYDQGGTALPTGTRITNPELATTLERIAIGGWQAFYDGPAAERLAANVAAATPKPQGMTVADITAYRAKEREPVCGAYRSYRICGMGPPSSGGVAVLQMLAQLQRFDLAALGPDSPTFWHLLLESQRLAYADRELYMGDDDFVSVPTAYLTGPGYMASRGELIDPDRAMETVEAGQLVPRLLRADGDEGPESGTSHFSVADATGNVVSYTSTIESAFGSGLFQDGFYLNNELTDFSFSPTVDGRPVANRVAGGKRPRSSMAPTIVYDAAGRPLLVIGAAGGATIPVQVTRAIIGVLDFGLPAQQAISLPLIMQFGDRVVVEKGTRLEGMIPQLEALGHSGIVAASVGLKGNALHRVDGRWVAASDPRLADLVAIP